MSKSSFHKIGFVRSDDAFVVKGRDGNEIIKDNVDSLLKSYKSTFEGF